jgi:pimeloyl-ACP methyl ester carboxylesterase
MLEHMRIAVGEPDREGDLFTISGARGLVMFTHADGERHSSRRSLELARRLQQFELSTLVFDLLTRREADDSAKTFDIELLVQRVLQAFDALPLALRDWPLGLFASGPGAAAALVAATRRPHSVGAVVSRGGRPDLAGDALGAVRAPTLLIVGAADTEVLELNRWAYTQLRCEKRIEVVPRATHLFMEAGALDSVAHRAGDWFCTHLRPRG